MTALCVVPARGGSTRIPRKNVRPFAGTPLIVRTIRTVVASGVADRVVVSTDDPDIADLARSAGADIPFLRSPELAGDHTPTIPVVADAIARLAETEGCSYDTTWVVYPTAALLEPGDLVAAQRTFVESGADVAFSVVETRAPIERAWRCDDAGRGSMVQPEHVETRTQDLPPAYFDAGQFYVAASGFWTAGARLTDADPLLIPLPPWRAIDIDTEDDWRLAEALHAAGRTD